MDDQPVFDRYQQTVFPDPVLVPVSVPSPTLVITMRHFVKLDGALGLDVSHAFHEAEARRRPDRRWSRATRGWTCSVLEVQRLPQWRLPQQACRR